MRYTIGCIATVIALSPGESSCWNTVLATGCGLSCVAYGGFDKKPNMFADEEYADMHFVHDFSNDSGGIPATISTSHKLRNVCERVQNYQNL